MTNDFIDRGVIPDRVEHILLNQAVWMERHKDWGGVLEKADEILARDSQTKLLPAVFMLRLNVLFLTDDLDAVEAEAEEILNHFPANTREGATAHLYLGAVACQRPSPDFSDAATHFDQILNTKFVPYQAGFDEGHLPTIAGRWRLWLARRTNDQDAIARVSKKMSQMPKSSMRDAALRMYGTTEVKSVLGEEIAQ